MIEQIITYVSLGISVITLCSGGLVYIIRLGPKMAELGREYVEQNRRISHLELSSTNITERLARIEAKLEVLIKRYDREV